jgi:hypothetical protein
MTAKVAFLPEPSVTRPGRVDYRGIVLSPTNMPLSKQTHSCQSPNEALQAAAKLARELKVSLK